MKDPKLNSFRERVELYLDHALDNEEEQELMQEVKSNPEYNKVLRGEQSFREFIRKNVHRPQVTPEMIQSIRDKVRIY